MILKANPTNLISEAKQLSEVLNNISDVLQAIEDNLRETNANFPFHLEVEKDPESNPKKPESYHGDFPFDIVGYRTQIVWSISWEEDEASKEGKFRLFITAEEKEIVYYNIPGNDPDDIKPTIFQTKLIFKRPLRQTKIPIRLRFSKHFDTFIKSFENHLKTYRNAIEKGDFSFSLD